MVTAIDVRDNRILSLLPPDELERLRPDLVLIEGKHHDVIYEHDEPIEFAYFPLGGVVSLIATDIEGRGVEMASVGREGMVGLAGVLSGGGMVGEVVQQISGPLARIEIGAVRAEMDRHERLATLFERYTVALLSQIGQGALCLRYHPVDPRAARWLLATHDRAGRNDFVLTQDFLALMLGVTRPQVSLAAEALKRAGLIDYRHGEIAIRDRAGLEAASCECYGLIRSEFIRLLGDSEGSSWTGVGG
jgi:CRP-like cAMP-binding protein